MREIKIQNSNIYIKEMNIGGPPEYKLGSDKSRMRYQYVVIENLKTGELTDKFPYGERSIYFHGNSDQKKIYLLMKSRKKFGSDIALSKAEKVTALRFVSKFVKYYPLECDSIIYAIRDQKLVDLYQASFGEMIGKKLIPYINNLIANPNLIVEGKNEDFFIKNYRRRYTVLDLLDDIKNDSGSKINMITDIINYNRVSPKIIDTSKNTIEYIDKPGDILGISKSKNRASVNITYKTFVNITKPDGTRYENFSTLKSFCVIKEGKLNTRYICVKINSKLAKKLKRLNAVYIKLEADTYILDLSKLPIYSRENVGSVQSWMLEKYEYNNQCLKFKEAYIKFLMEKNGIKDPEIPEIDLVNKTYNPKQVSRKSNGHYYINSYEPVINDCYFPKDSTRRKILFNNSGKLRQGSTPANIIQEVDDMLKLETLENLLDRTKQEMKKNSELLSNSKFKLILSKDCKFNSGIGKTAYGRNMSLKGKYGEITLMWNIKEQKVYTYEKRESIN